MEENKIRLYGTTWCPDCQRSKKLLGEYNIDYDFIDIDKDFASAKYVEQLNHGIRVIPTILLQNGNTLVKPTKKELFYALNISETRKEQYSDLIIIGAGLTGLTSAIYTTLEGIETTVIERNFPGGQSAITDTIENYPGFPNGISGKILSENLINQAANFGAKIVNAQVIDIKDNGLYKRVETSNGIFISKAIIISTGSDYKRTNSIGEDKFIGKGIHFCATCDGPLYRDRNISVIGGGNSALQKGIFLSKFARHITFLVRGNNLKADKILQQKVAEMKDNFTIMYNTTVVEFIGETQLEKLVIQINAGREREFLTDGVFIFVGICPNTQFLNNIIDLDEKGFIKTNIMLETNITGVFAAGDCRETATTQIASAAGEGATAAIMVKEFLNKL